jgi:1,2-phenylacetyl-CoA epoxidase PaaB subunit
VLTDLNILQDEIDTQQDAYYKSNTDGNLHGQIIRDNYNRRTETALQWAEKSLTIITCTPEDGQLGRNM